MKIDFKKSFKKSFKKLPVKIQDKSENKINIFKQNPFEFELNNHKLK